MSALSKAKMEMFLSGEGKLCWLGDRNTERNCLAVMANTTVKVWVTERKCSQERMKTIMSKARKLMLKMIQIYGMQTDHSMEEKIVGKILAE